MEKTKINHEEILFFYRNAPAGFARIVHDNLKDAGFSINRTQVHRELYTLKKDYLKPVIDEARRVLTAIKGIEFNTINN